MSNGITVQESTGRLIYANPAIARLLNPTLLADLFSCEPACVLTGTHGKTPPELLPGCQVLRGEQLATQILHVRTESLGEDRKLELQAHPIRDASGRAAYAVTTWHGITGPESTIARDRGLAAIVLTSDDAIVSKTLDGTVTSWNPAAERLFGWPAAEMIGQSIQRIVPPEKRDDLADILTRLGRGERIDHHETVRITREGRRIDVSVSISPVVNHEGQIVGAAKICRDVTARKRAESGQRLLAAAGEVLAALLDAEATLKSVTRIPVGPLSDVATAYIAAADGSLRQIATAHGGKTSEAWAIAQINDAKISALIQDSIVSGKATLHSWTNWEPNINGAPSEKRSDRELLQPLSAMVVPLMARGQLLGALAFYSAAPRRPYDEVDLELAGELGRRTALAIDNAQLYAEARSAETRYRALFDGGAVGVVVIGADGRYLEANDVALGLLGRTLAEIRELRIGDGSVGSSDEESSLWAILNTTGAWHGELDLHRPDHETIPIEVHAEAVALQEGTVYLIQWLDVTDRKISERLEDSFLADLAHDLNNPLACMRVQAQLMQRRLLKGVLDERVTRDGLAAIETSTSRMARRITELADIARLRIGGSLELSTEEFDLVALVQELRMRHQQATDRHVVTLKSPASQLLVTWDRQRLERVFDHLLANAIKYSPKGGVVSVALAVEEPQEGMQARVTFSDEGVGISAVDLPFVLGRFHRGTNVAGRLAGAGIGLSEARQIIEQHEGTIEMSSTEGGGTTVTVRLPLVPVGVMVSGEIGAVT